MEHQTIDSISPIFAYWNDTGKPLAHHNDSYGQRVVEHYEIEYIVYSQNGYILTNNIPIPAETHDVFFRYPGMVIEGIGIYRAIYVEFDLNIDKDLFPIFHSIPSIFKDLDSMFNSEIMNALFLPEEASETDKLLWKSKILRILTFLLEHTKTNEKWILTGDAKKHLEPIQNALLYVQNHYIENITLEDLSNVSGYNMQYFCKLFKKVTELTPMQYVVRYRMNQAAKKLIFSNDSIEKIMLDTGFCNYGYFWRTFKNLYGVSPRTYRQNNLKELE